MKVRIEVDEKMLVELVHKYLREKIVPELTKDIKIEVKSKQNYKSEWESAAFRAVYEGEV